LQVDRERNVVDRERNVVDRERNVVDRERNVVDRERNVVAYTLLQFVAGTNTLQIRVISGSSGTGFLSPGHSYNAVELDN
jgi:hypothetical protein